MVAGYDVVSQAKNVLYNQIEVLKKNWIIYEITKYRTKNHSNKKTPSQYIFRNCVVKTPQTKSSHRENGFSLCQFLVCNKMWKICFQVKSLCVSKSKPNSFSYKKNKTGSCNLIVTVGEENKILIIIIWRKKKI